MRILITGSRGMVGQNLLEHPGLAEFEVLTPSRQELDLKNSQNVISYLQTHRPDFVIHAAGRVGGIQDNIKNPLDFLVENIDINRNLIISCFEQGISKFLNLGSSCMYPRNSEVALTEDMILKGELEPTNEGYALAKVMALRMCQYINKKDSSMSYKTLVPCNLYGRHDKFDPKNSHLLPAIIVKIHTALKQKSDKVEIWGDGLARREFMFAGDFSDCIVNAVHKFDSLPEVMNVGLGHDYSINDYYSAVAKVAGYSGTFTHDLSQPTGMKRKLVSIEQQKRWGWQSRISLSEGIEKTYQFYLQDAGRK